MKLILVFLFVFIGCTTLRQKQETVVNEYIIYLDSQAKYKQLSAMYKVTIEPYIKAPLELVQYAEDIETGHGMAITIGNKIYFTKKIDLRMYTDILWLIHELIHVEQYFRIGGVTPFMDKYIFQGGKAIVEKRRFTIHDDIKLEKEASRRSREIAPAVWTTLNRIRPFHFEED